MHLVSADACKNHQPVDTVATHLNSDGDLVEMMVPCWCGLTEACSRMHEGAGHSMGPCR